MSFIFRDEPGSYAGQDDLNGESPALEVMKFKDPEGYFGGLFHLIIKNSYCIIIISYKLLMQYLMKMKTVNKYIDNHLVFCTHQPV